MKTGVFAVICVILAILSSTRVAFADDPAVAVLEEKVNNLSAQLEALQDSYVHLQKDMATVQTQLQEIRQATGGVTPADLQALEDRMQAARQKDRQVLIDQLAKELAKGGKSIGNPPSSSSTSATDDSKEHTVVKGENLTAIAKSYGVTVSALRKANNLTSNEIKIGQKLVIPQAGQN